MTDATITCPKCGEAIPLTETLAGPMLENAKRDFAARLAKQEEELRRKAGEWKKQVTIDEAKRAREEAALEIEQRGEELARLQKTLDQSNTKLAEAQREQAEAVRRQRELDDRERELDLTIEKRIQAGIGEARDLAGKAAAEQYRLQVSEREQTIAGMAEQIEALRRKAEQGSQQMQGEVLELEIETLLAAKFPHDSIEPVPKGVHGGDVLQRVRTPQGADCGSILWELKRTKSWSPSWLPKLRNDQREAKADVSIIASQVLPKDVESFDLIDGVWVADPRVAVPMAIAVRNALIDVANARAAGEGIQTKTELVYDYLTGQQFRQRVEAIVEAFDTMRSDLEAEKKAITKQWAKRETQLGRVMQSTAGMYGDLQGIAGAAILEVEGLEIKALTEGNGNG